MITQKHYRQIRNNLCFLYALINCISYELLRTYQYINVSPYWLIRNFFKYKGYKEVFSRLSFGYRDLGDFNETRAVIDGKAVDIKFKVTPCNFDKTINKRPMIGTIYEGTHAIVVIQMEKDYVLICDSQSKSRLRLINSQLLGKDFYKVTIILPQVNLRKE